MEPALLARAGGVPRSLAARIQILAHGRPHGQRLWRPSSGLFLRRDGSAPKLGAETVNMKITEILMAEHAVFHNLFDHIEATVPRVKTLAEVKSLGLIMGKLMAPHSRTEDDLFIAPLEHCFDQLGQKETFHHEHELIDQTLEKVQKARSLRVAREFLLSAVATSRNHFDKEERIVFPLAEQTLKTRTLTELGAEWLKKRDSKLRQTK